MAEEKKKKGWLWALLILFGIGAILGIAYMTGAFKPPTPPSKKCKVTIKYDYTGQDLGTIQVNLYVKDKATSQSIKEWLNIDCAKDPTTKSVDVELDIGTYIVTMEYKNPALAGIFTTSIELIITQDDVKAGSKEVFMQVNISAPLPPPPAYKTLTVQLINGYEMQTDNVVLLEEAGLLVSVQIADASGNTQSIPNVPTDETGKAQFQIPEGWCIDAILVQKPGDPNNITLAKCIANGDVTKGMTMNGDRTVYIPFYGANDGDAGSMLLILYTNEQKPDSTPWIAVHNDEIDETIHELTEDYGLFVGRYLHIGPYFPFPEPGWHFECARDDYPNKEWRFQYININTWHVVIMDNPVANVPLIPPLPPM